MDINSFSRSDIGAQSAWKGFTSQTLYILFRLVKEQNDTYDYYPEHLEDLMIKDGNVPIEVVQVKDLSHELALSDLDSSSQSEGLFRRALSLHKNSNDKLIIRVVHFGPLGAELEGFSKGTIQYIDSVKKKFSDRYGFKDIEISWLLERIKFEKVDVQELIQATLNQVSNYVPAMSSPQLVHDLLTYFVFTLSKTKGKTSKREWQEKVMQIGSDMAAFDGYFREYGSSLVRLLDMKASMPPIELEREFRQGVSTRPEHIRAGLDLERYRWMDKINCLFGNSSVVLVKGASGQGKSALCYRYIIKHYKEEQVFCVRRIKTSAQAENLVKAMVGLSKHYLKDLILYIDINPGEYEWVWLVREAQARGLGLRILASIREEDFALTNADQSQVTFCILDLELCEDEARWIFQTLTQEVPHQIYRSFEEAWQTFGCSGPFLEFIYLLNNNQTLQQRLESQVHKLVLDAHSDSESWSSLLRLVSYAGQIGCPVSLIDAKSITACHNIKAALDRMAEEYLIRSTTDGRYLEALHPLRAKIIYRILKDNNLYPEKELLLQSLYCTERQYPKLLLLNYFLNHPYEDDVITCISDINCKDWEAFAGTLNAMLWLDVRHYVDKNCELFEQLCQEKGQGRAVFIPMDITGILRPDEFVGDKLVSSFPDIADYLEKIKRKYNSLSVEYRATDTWIQNTRLPQVFPKYDSEWVGMGYTLFWMNQRGRKETLPFADESIIEAMYIGSLENKVAAVKGFFYQGQSILYKKCETVLRDRIIKENKVVWIDDTEESITCGFIPPFFKNDDSIKEKNLNHFWTMRMVGFLSRLYPDKQVVGAELVGIDLLSDLGVNVIDGHKNIPKENRPDEWITELNSWHFNMVDFSNRPDNWNEYVSNVLYIRHEIVDTLSSLIQLIDKLYDKGHIAGTKASDKMRELYNKLLNADFLLPKSVVDPYGLHGEGSTLEERFLPSLTNLSIKPYDRFRKALNDFIASLRNFIGQCSEVIIARINRQSIEIVSNWHLTGINLYNGIKQSRIVQEEFKKLFLSYTDSSYNTFEEQERKVFVLLLNIWYDVLQNPVIGDQTLSYYAKQTIKRIESKIAKAFQIVLNSDKWSMNIRDIPDDDGIIKRYLLCDYEISEGYAIEWYYKALCIELRSLWHEAKEYNGYRWYLETQWPEMIFVPLYAGCPMFGAFSMPLYKILDISEDQIDKLYIPVELPKALIEISSEKNETYMQWRQGVAEVAKLRMLFMQYQQIFDTINSENISITQVGIAEWFLDWINEVSITSDLVTSTISKEMEHIFNSNDEEVKEICSYIVLNFTELGEKIEAIKQFQPLEGAFECLQNIMIGMIFLTPLFTKDDQVGG